MSYQIDLPNGDVVVVEATRQAVVGDTLTVRLVSANASVAVVMPVAAGRQLAAALDAAADDDLPSGPAQRAPAVPLTEIDEAEEALRADYERAKRVYERSLALRAAARLDAAEVDAEYRALVAQCSGSPSRAPNGVATHDADLGLQRRLYEAERCRNEAYIAASDRFARSVELGLRQSECLAALADARLRRLGLDGPDDCDGDEPESA